MDILFIRTKEVQETDFRSNHLFAKNVLKYGGVVYHAERTKYRKIIKVCYKVDSDGSSSHHG